MSQFQEIPDLTVDEFKQFASLIHNKAGITLKDTKITLLSNRLRKRLKALGMNNFQEYYTLITGKDSRMNEEMVHFLEAVTTNESYFWRTTNNFDLLREFILPDLLKKNKGKTLRVWSAGCSTGEEAYNLAIELIESMKTTGVFEFDLHASDISQRVIDFAKEGVYSGRKIDKIPEKVLHRYFREDQQTPGNFVVREDLKNRIKFHVENIYEANHPPFHLIFCRNVMIYFSRADQERLANHFYSLLVPGGYLVIGHSESLHMMNTPFEALHKDQGIVYYKNPGEKGNG